MDKYNYKKESYYMRQHHKRFKKFVTSFKNLLFCQECRGDGGFKEPILDDGSGPWFECGWCEGTGFMTPYGRGMWLKYKKQEKHRVR